MINTTSVKWFDGVPITIPNKIVSNKKDFYISYNSRDTGTYGCATTAIVIGNCKYFFILDGNHTEQLKDIEDVDDAIRYYESHKDKWNSMSDTLEDYRAGIHPMTAVLAKTEAKMKPKDEVCSVQP